MKNKIIEIRNKYEWKATYEIIFGKGIEFKDRIFMIVMGLWFYPAKIILLSLWFLLYMPAMAFALISKTLDR